MVSQALVNVLGALGAGSLALCLVPQIIKSIATRSAEDLSYAWTAAYMVGLVFTMVYLILEKALVGWIGIVVELSLLLALIVLKAYLDRFYKGPVKEWDPNTLNPSVRAISASVHSGRTFSTRPVSPRLPGDRSRHGSVDGSRRGSVRNGSRGAADLEGGLQLGGVTLRNASRPLTLADEGGQPLALLTQRGTGRHASWHVAVDFWQRLPLPGTKPGASMPVAAAAAAAAACNGNGNSAGRSMHGASNGSSGRGTNGITAGESGAAAAQPRSQSSSVHGHVPASSGLQACLAVAVADALQQQGPLREAQMSASTAAPTSPARVGSATEGVPGAAACLGAPSPPAVSNDDSNGLRNAHGAGGGAAQAAASQGSWVATWSAAGASVTAVWQADSGLLTVDGLLAGHDAPKQATVLVRRVHDALAVAQPQLQAIRPAA